MTSNSLKVGVQSFGRFLSGMVMPNIGAFIAWGLITALFIPTGLTFRTSRRRYFGNFPRPDCLSGNGTIGAQRHLEQSQYLAL